MAELAFSFDAMFFSSSVNNVRCLVSLFKGAFFGENVTIPLLCSG